MFGRRSGLHHRQPRSRGLRGCASVQMKFLHCSTRLAIPRCSSLKFRPITGFGGVRGKNAEAALPCNYCGMLRLLLRIRSRHRIKVWRYGYVAFCRQYVRLEAGEIIVQALVQKLSWTLDIQDEDVDLTCIWSGQLGSTGDEIFNLRGEYHCLWDYGKSTSTLHRSDGRGRPSGKHMHRLFSKVQYLSFIFW